VLINQLLPYAHRVSATCQAFFDELAVWFRGARSRDRVGGHLYGRFCRDRGTGVGGHLIGRFCRSTLSPAAWRADRDAAALRYAAAVSRRIRVVCWIWRRDQPNWPRAMTWFFFSSLKTLLTLTEGYPPPDSMSRSAVSIGRFSGDHQWPVLGDRRGSRGSHQPAVNRVSEKASQLQEIR
jgi:hypothetical protein